MEEITIEEQPSSPLAITSGGQGNAVDLVNFANQLEVMEKAYTKIKEAAIKRTNENDWCSLGGKPYCQGTGWEKQARFFNVTWKIIETTTTHDADGHYTITMKGLFCWAVTNAEIEIIGTKSTKNKFYKRYETVDKEKVELPASEILKQIDPGIVTGKLILC